VARAGIARGFNALETDSIGGGKALNQTGAAQKFQVIETLVAGMSPGSGTGMARVSNRPRASRL